MWRLPSRAIAPVGAPHVYKKVGEREAIELAWNAIQSGARGVDMGRNIFQSDCPVGMIKAVRGVVQDNLDVKQAIEIYEQLRGEAGDRQVKDAKIGLAQNMGGSGASSVVHIFGRA